MKKYSKIILVSIILFVLLIFLGSRIGYSYDDQWCTKCGHIRHIKTQCYGLFCKQAHEVIDENYFSKYWEKTHGECGEHSWVNYHGGRNFLLNKLTYSGSKPFWWIWRIIESPYDVDYLGFLYDNDSDLVKELLEYMLYLEKQRIIERQYSSEEHSEFLKNFSEFRTSYFPEHTDFNKEEEFDKFNTWWQSYKEELNL